MHDDVELYVPAREREERRFPRVSGVLWRLWVVIGAVAVGIFGLETLAGPERGVMLQIALAIAAVWLAVAWIFGALPLRRDRR